MNQETLNEYKKKLERERLLLLGEVKQAETPANFGSDVDGFDEKTDEAEDIGNQQAVAQDLKNRLDEIDVALSKIHSGTYGVCEKCGKEIEEELLEIDPESHLCKECKLSR
jgi:DnaK suppressor protein